MPDQPNILLLMTDQQRWDALGCVSHWIKTPNLDRIAREGIRFTNCATNSPVCIPTRLSMATGLYPHNTNVWNNTDHTLDPKTPTFMQAIRNAGYRTGLIGKTHFHPNRGDLRDREDLHHAHGFDDVNEIGGPRASARVLSHMTAEWDWKGIWQAYRDDYADRFGNKPHVVRPSVLGLENYADVYVGQHTKRYIENYDRDQPWFVFCSFGGPHEPWDTPEPFASLYDPDQMPSEIPRPDDPPHKRPKGQLDQMFDQTQIDFEDGEIARMRADYAGNVTLIDQQIGEILSAIEARGELDRTVIAFVSDHGEMNGDFGLIYKSNFLNSAVRVPLLIRTPETARSEIEDRICESPVELFDLGPTLAEIAGGDLKHQQFAKSLCPVLSDPSHTHRSEAISEFRGEVMLLNREWKIAINREGEAYLLFDQINDLDEINNLAGLPEFRGLETDLRLRILDRIIESQIYI